MGENPEIGFMLVIAAGFIWKIPACLFLGVFLMGCHSTLFGPPNSRICRNTSRITNSPAAMAWWRWGRL